MYKLARSRATASVLRSAKVGSRDEIGDSDRMDNALTLTFLSLLCLSSPRSFLLSDQALPSSKGEISASTNIALPISYDRYTYLRHTIPEYQYPLPY